MLSIRFSGYFKRKPNNVNNLSIRDHVGNFKKARSKYIEIPLYMSVNKENKE